MTSPVGKLIEAITPKNTSPQKAHWRDIRYRVAGGVVYEPLGWVDYAKNTKRTWCMKVLGCIPEGYKSGVCFPFDRKDYSIGDESVCAARRRQHHAKRLISE